MKDEGARRRARTEVNMTVRRTGNSPVQLPRAAEVQQPAAQAPEAVAQPEAPSGGVEASGPQALSPEAQAGVEGFAQDQQGAPAFQGTRPQNALNAQLAIRMGASAAEARYGGVIDALSDIAAKAQGMSPAQIEHALEHVDFPTDDAIQFLWSPEGTAVRREMFDLLAQLADIAPDAVVMQNPGTGKPLTLKENAMITRVVEAQFLKEPLMLEQAMQSYLEAFPDGAQSGWIKARLGLDEASLQKAAQAEEAMRLAEELKGAQVDVLAHGMVERGPEGFELSFEGSVIRDNQLRNAQVALATPSFKDRNALHAASVADEAALLAAHALGADKAEARRLHDVFGDATQKAGEAFKGAFSSDGKPDLFKLETDYEPAMKAAGAIAYAALAEATGSDPAAAVSKATLGDVAEIVKRDLKLHVDTDAYALHETLRYLEDGVLGKDRLRHEIRNIKPTDDRLSSDDQDALSLGLRLADATWKAGQVHRAAFEGTDHRIDPGKYPAYDAYDHGLAQLFDATRAQWLAEGGSESSADHVAFARTVFEAYKSLLELKAATPSIQN